ncbi:MAG TPA: GNAT family N-acetyltransferase [Ilumatobacteraceae bacterium]|jgi:ribosomal protein S18 acetylase RimI-like enzyme
MSRVTLVELSDVEREEFIRADVADYADYTQELAAGEPSSIALSVERARAELEPRLRREHAEAEGKCHRRWTALDADGSAVGWLWVTPAHAGMPPDSVYLYQILVKSARRREGYGRAMLTALEESLSAEGIAQIRLDVFDTNHRAKALYEGAGYTFVKSLEGMTQLGKRFGH